MRRRVLVFIALAVTILYGVGFAAFDTTRGYAAIGAGLVAIIWIAVGLFTRDEHDPPRRL